MQAPSKAAGFTFLLHHVLDLTAPDVMYSSIRLDQNLSFPFLTCPSLSPFPGHSRWVRLHALAQEWLCASRSLALPFISPSKTQNFKSAQLKSCLSPRLTSFQLLQAEIPTGFFLHFHCFFLQQPNQMGMVVALHKKAVSGVTGKLKGYSGELFSWI